MDLTTEYLGFRLPHPFIAGASPLADDLDTVRRLEDAGVAAVVMRSLFEEQISAEALATHDATESHAESFAEALTYFPSSDAFVLGPHEYLEQIRRIKEILGIPLIASLNGSTAGGWLEYAQLLEQAGADALELNVYDVAIDPDETGQVVEQRAVDMVRAVTGAVGVPVAVKLSPFYTSLVNFARQLTDAGADALVLLNRFFEPDVDVEELAVVSRLRLSDPTELPLRLRWLAILSARLRTDLAVTGGVHGALETIKAVMCGAHAVQMVSALLQRGAGHLLTLLTELREWMEEKEYTSLEQMRGSMNLLRCPDPQSYQRANYIHMLQTWEAPD